MARRLLSRNPRDSLVQDRSGQSQLRRRRHAGTVGQAEQIFERHGKKEEQQGAHPLGQHDDPASLSIVAPLPRPTCDRAR
jgi:hypothetical protein